MMDQKVNVKRILQNNIYMLRYVYKYCKSHIAFTFLSAILGSASPVVNLLITRYIINALSSGESGDLFLSVAFFVTALMAFNIVSILISTYISQKLVPKNTQIFHQKMQLELFAKAKEIELKCYEDSDFYNKFSMAMAQSDQRALAVLNTLTSFISSLFGLSALIALVSTIEPVIIALSILSVIISFAASTKSMKVQHAYTKEQIPVQRESEYIKRVFYLQEFAKELRLFRGLDDVLKDKYNLSIDKSLALVDTYGNKFRKYSRIQGITNTILNGVTIVFLAYKVIKKQLLLGDFVMASTGSQQLASQISSFLSTFPQMYEHNLYIENFREFVEYNPAINNGVGEKLDKIHGVEIDGLSFTYPKTEKVVLSDISMKILAGERIAVVGKNGAGKSTLVKLIARLYEPTSGRITINGRLGSDYSADSLRDSIGIVFQDYQVFATSIAENVLMRALVNAEDERLVIEALKFAGLYKKIVGLTEGISSIITREFSNDGVFLSGGELQKLALARVYARNCSLIVLDEPSSALDPIAASDMFSRMKLLSKDKCALIISHRLSNIIDADKIYVMNDGVFVEVGTHDELMKRGGLYFDMFYRQNGQTCKN